MRSAGHFVVWTRPIGLLACCCDFSVWDTYTPPAPDRTRRRSRRCIRHLLAATPLLHKHNNAPHPRRPRGDSFDTTVFTAGTPHAFRPFPRLITSWDAGSSERPQLRSSSFLPLDGFFLLPCGYRNSFCWDGRVYCGNGCRVVVVVVVVVFTNVYRAVP